jgi:hypothetical protein
VNLRFSIFVGALLLASASSLTAHLVNSKPEKPAAPCRIGEQAPPIGFWTWPHNARVKVYVRALDFTPKQIPYLVAALKNWNAVSDLTGSGVKFDFRGETNETLNCESCITIIRGHVFDTKRHHVTELRAFSIKRNQIITYAVIVVDPLLTEPKVLTEALAHELGHNLGLLDCYECKRKTTLMGKFKEINVPNNLAEPTPCDITQVKEAYQELRVRVRPSPKMGLAEDEGEEPVDDDTPVIIPKP